MPSTVDADRRSFPVWPRAGLLAFATVILYWPATGGGFVNFDDNLYVTANAQVQSGLTLAGLKWDWFHAVASNWHPLTLLSHQLDCQLFGLQPWGHHLTSVLLHALNVALIFRLLNLLTGSIWRSGLVAALFAVHPLHVESVAWVAERKDVLSSFFGLLSLIFYARFALRRKAAQGQASETRPAPVRAPDYLLALIFLTLGLLSKAMLVTWPFVMLLLDYWPLGRFQPGRWWTLVREKIPFFLLAAAACIVTLLVQQQAGAMAGVTNVSASARIANALVSYVRYLEKLFCPVHLAIFYPLPAHWPAIKVLVAGALLAGLSLICYRTRRSQPFLLMGWLWFLGTLVPVIGLVQVGEQSMADRYAYLPSLGILIMVAWGATALTRRWLFQFQALALTGGGALILCLSRQILKYTNVFYCLIYPPCYETGMPRHSPYPIVLSHSEKQELSRRAAKYTLPYFEVLRARMILHAAEGLANDETARRLDTRREVVSLWRKRFFTERLAGLEELPRLGRPRSFPPGSRGAN